ncbi:LuxR family transcriptional regulator [Kribbella sp. NPDC000426]|uniref:helix-turn-helix transcriptional regulator n=1 Tax=Kribbella sp. NPDC000426 TaxID=3154255 RepID=UPI00332BE171
MDAKAAPPGPGLVGRDREVAQLQEIVHGLGPGGSCLLIEGAAGVGKTALLEAAALCAEQAHCEVLFTATAEFEAELPYAALHMVVQTLLPRGNAAPSSAALEPLLVALGIERGDIPTAVGVGSALLTLLDHASRDRALVILLDDVHWIDRSSATVLSFVARRLSSIAIGLIVATREAGSYFDVPGLPRLVLEPLDEQAAAALLERHDPTMPVTDRMEILNEAQGNPLALLELPSALRAARERGSGAPGLPVTRRLQRMYDARIEDLSPRAAHLLLLAALEGSGNLAVLPDQDQLSAALGEVEESGLAYLDHRLRLIFRHPLVRSVVVQRCSAPTLRRAHAELAEALSDDPDREAWHLSQAATSPDREVSARLETAARSALDRGDGVSAVRTLLRAADLSPDREVRARRLSEAAFIGADVTGDLSRVSALLDEARQHDPMQQMSLQAASAAAYALLNGDGDVETAFRMLKQAVEPNMGSAVDRDALDEALLIMLAVCLWAMNPAHYATFTQFLENLGDDVRDDLRLEAALIADPVRTALPVLPQLDAAIARLTQETNLVQIERMARAGAYVDRIAPCRDALWRVVQSGRSGGALTTGVNALAHLGAEALRTGHWDEALELADEGLTMCAQRGYWLPAWQFRRIKGLVAAARGQYQESEQLADLCERWAAPRGIRGVRIFGAHIRAWQSLSSADWETASTQLETIGALGELPELVAYVLRVPLDVVEAAVRAGRLPEARLHLQALREAQVASISPRHLFLLRCCELWVASDDELPSAYDLLADSDGDKWPFALARTLLGHGERLRRARDTAASRPHLERSLEIFRGLEARPWAARASSELRAAGRATGPSSTMYLHPSISLTAQELQIATLAATGLTNKQIAAQLNLSHRTIGAHLRSVFAKMGISSRAALGQALANSFPERLGTSGGVRGTDPGGH